MIPRPSNAQLEPAASEAQPTTTTEAVAVPDNSVEMADAMRRNGKIYVVVAVILVIFSGLVIYLFRIDRKVTMLEKELS